MHSISLIWFLAISYLLSAILLSDCKFENYLFLNHTHTHIWECGKLFERYIFVWILYTIIRISKTFHCIAIATKENHSHFYQWSYLMLQKKQNKVWNTYSFAHGLVLGWRWGVIDRCNIVRPTKFYISISCVIMYFGPIE